MRQLTEDVHESETVVERHSHEEAGESENAEVVRKRGHNARHRSDQVAKYEGGDAAESVGDEAQQHAADDTAAKEDGLRQRCVTGLVAHPIFLYTIKAMS